MFRFGKKKVSDREVLRQKCEDLGGTFVEDGDDRDFSCVVDRFGLSITYVSAHRMYILTLVDENRTTVVQFKNLPEIKVSVSDYYIKVDSPELVSVSGSAR